MYIEIYLKWLQFQNHIQLMISIIFLFSMCDMKSANGYIPWLKKNFISVGGPKLIIYILCQTSIIQMCFNVVKVTHHGDTSTIPVLRKIHFY